MDLTFAAVRMQFKLILRITLFGDHSVYAQRDDHRSQCMRMHLRAMPDLATTSHHTHRRRSASSPTLFHDNNRYLFANE